MRLLFSGLLVVALGVMAYESTGIKGAGAFYPISISVGALVGAVAFMASQWKMAGGPTETPGWLRLSRIGVARLVAFGGLWAGYVLGLPTLGFTLATWGALVLSLALLRGRPTVQAVAGTGLFVMAFVLLIKTVLYVPVPMGWLDTRIEEILYTL